MNVPQVLLKRTKEVIPRDQRVAATIGAVRAQEVVAMARGLRGVADCAQEHQVLDKKMWCYLLSSYLHKLEQSTLRGK